ncbi:MAG: lamin tail domain-containing protein [Planctomycetota bacterium]|nr:lamin tail domain-containing protein [Planctomycetota bacterium]
MIKKTCLLAILAATSIATSSAMAVTPNPGIWLTEFNSNSGLDDANTEFMEFTNLSDSPIDMAGWSQSDADRDIQNATHMLSAFGILQPGESAIITEATPDAFRTYWWGSVEAAPAGLKIIGPYSNDNLSSGGDEINLYGPDAVNNVTDYADRLWYSSLPGSESFPQGGGTAKGVTRNPSSWDILGENVNYLWVDSSIDDVYGSFAAAGSPHNLLGNPGIFLLPAPIDGDLNSDGFVGQDDLNLILGNWGQSVPPGNPLADADGSGFIGQDDLNVVLGGWGQGTPPSVTPVPEPATIVLLGLAGVGLAAYRRRQK